MTCPRHHPPPSTRVVLLLVAGLLTHPQARAQTTGRPVLQDPLDGRRPATCQPDPSTLKHKVLCGYQGWFATPGDGTKLGWKHYAGAGGRFDPGHCSIDLWPDVSELDADEKYPTPFKHDDGSQACVFSSSNRKTVMRHFQWMQQYGIDGIFLQRFGSSLRSAASRRQRDLVTTHVRAAALQYRRVWALMYDLSGLRSGEILSLVMPDWKHLHNVLKITQDKTYLHENGKPVVAVWGIGFNDGRAYTLDQCLQLVRFLKHDKTCGGNTVMVGVPTYWRSLGRDAVADPRLHRIIQEADMVSPWTVGRYRTPEQARRHVAQCVRTDLAWCRAHRLQYLPVIFPGFSWHNLQRARGRQSPLDQIPRLKGRFLWSQAVALKQAGVDMIYLAMFDEMDEATAIFKCTNRPPVGPSPFLTYQGLPSDHYLWLAGQIGRMLRGQVPAQSEMPSR